MIAKTDTHPPDHIVEQGFDLVAGQDLVDLCFDKPAVIGMVKTANAVAFPNQQAATDHTCASGL